LSAKCTTKSDLILSDGFKLSDFEVHIGVLKGELPAKQRELVKLSEEAIGGVWWLADTKFVHGWFYLQTEEYAALWEQINNSQYVDCGIKLIFLVEYTGGKFAWSGNPLCIDSAEVYIERKKIKQHEVNNKSTESGLLAYTNRWWAVVLFFGAAAAEFERFFEPSKDVTTGEGRIVAAVMFVGGLLLWFLRER
jgi:hypothetical protein